ncbi:MAG TPA: hypothetical protein VGB45_02460 [Abditibacterium sp.]|jgi:hypothetical protein
MDDFSFPNSQPDEAPIIRIVNTILVYAIKNGADEIHLQRLPEDRGVKVCYLLHKSKTWHEEMALPSSCYQPIVDRFTEMAGDEDFIELTCQGESYQLRTVHLEEASVQNGAQGETMVWKLDGHFNSPDAEMRS